MEQEWYVQVCFFSAFQLFIDRINRILTYIFKSVLSCLVLDRLLGQKLAEVTVVLNSLARTSYK